jgi:hypothetical protein
MDKAAEGSHGANRAAAHTIAGVGGWLMDQSKEAEITHDLSVTEKYVLSLFK